MTGHVVHFTLKSAKGPGVHEKVDTVGRNDIYAVVKCGHQKYNSEVAKEGGVLDTPYPGVNITYLPQSLRSYKFNQDFEFNVREKDNFIEVKLYDKDIGFDDFIGEAKFSLDHARQSGRANEKVPLTNKKHEENGVVKGNIRFS